MADIEGGVLLVQALIVAVPATYVIFIVRTVGAARRFDRYFRRTYPEKAKDVVKRWPAAMRRLSPAPLFSLSFWEKDMPADETLKVLKRRAIRSFFALCLLTMLLVLLGLQCARSIEGTGSR